MTVQHLEDVVVIYDFSSVDGGLRQQIAQSQTQRARLESAHATLGRFDIGRAIQGSFSKFRLRSADVQFRSPDVDVQNSRSGSSGGGGMNLL